MLADEESRNAIAAFEAIADGRTIDAMSLLWTADRSQFVISFDKKYRYKGLMFEKKLDGTETALSSVEMVAEAEAAEAEDPNTEKYYRAFVPLVRDIFGNPFRPVSFSPEWCTDTALTLARQMYDSRDFSVMPILADALQDAGCDSDDILSHCRQPGEHVRGCWVVDLVLGKE
jgi:hypothetical protein